MSKKHYGTGISAARISVAHATSTSVHLNIGPYDKKPVLTYAAVSSASVNSSDV